MFKIENCTDTCRITLDKYRSLLDNKKLPRDIRESYEEVNTRRPDVSHAVWHIWHQTFLYGFLMASGVSSEESYDTAEFAEQFNFWIK